MNAPVREIRRKNPRPGGIEVPLETSRGYQLANPANGKFKHHAKHAIYAKTLDEVADLLARGYSLWMTRPGKRPSLISPGALEVTRS